MKVEEERPPPEPETEEAPTGIPWSQRLRGWGLQLLAPAVSLLIAASVGVFIVNVVNNTLSASVIVRAALSKLTNGRCSAVAGSASQNSESVTTVVTLSLHVG